MEHTTEAGPVTETGPGPVQPGDFVSTTRIGTAYGFVFDIIGDVHRVHWTSAPAPDAVEGLNPHTADDLRIVYRPDAYLSVRFTGDGEDAPYAFVYTSSSLAEAANAERVFRAAGNYEITGSRFGLADVSDGGGGDDPSDGGPELPDA